MIPVRQGTHKCGNSRIVSALIHVKISGLILLYPTIGPILDKRIRKGCRLVCRCRRGRTEEFLVDVLPGMNAGASTAASPSPIEGSGTTWVGLAAWASSPARPTPIHLRPEGRSLPALFGEMADNDNTLATERAGVTIQPGDTCPVCHQGRMQLIKAYYRHRAAWDPSVAVPHLDTS
jgi:hypothetical protein